MTTRREEEETMKLAQVEGLEPDVIARLSATGIETTHDLLARGAEPAGRAEITGVSGLTEPALLALLFRADLERVHGIGWDYAGLLVEAGVGTVTDLAYRQAEELRKRMMAVNAERSLVKRVPSLAQVTAWIDHARTLPGVLTFSGGGETY
jgi:predicted RecB family nuclease